MIKSPCRADDGTRRNRKSPKGWQTSSGGSPLLCTPHELINVKRASDRGFRRWASGTKSDFSIIEPGYRSLIVCQSPGRSCVPVSRGSLDSLSAPVMNPLPGFSDQVKVQVEIEQCQRGLVGRQRAGNRVFIDGLVTQEDLDGFRPRLIDLPCPGLLISIAQVKPDKTDELIVLSGRCRLFQEWNGHDLVLCMV